MESLKVKPKLETELSEEHETCREAWGLGGPRGQRPAPELEPWARIIGGDP